jgi:hypothetical protein
MPYCNGGKTKETKYQFTRRRLWKKACLIMGGATGIDASTAVELAGRRTRFAISDLVFDEAAMTVKSSGLPIHLAIVRGEQSKWVMRYDVTASTLGSLGVLVHHVDCPAPGSLWGVWPEVWHKACRTRASAISHCTPDTIPWMKTKREEAILLRSV